MVDLEQLLPALARAGVELIIVGGVAAIVHGSARLTQDLDIVYRRTPENVARLATRLGAVDHPDGRRKSQRQPVPRGGGVVLVIAAMLAIAVAQMLFHPPQISSAALVMRSSA